MKHTIRKGFTLIELLVVIAIIAVLSVVVILTLNPAELLRQARDSNRISDLNTLKSAIALFLADVTTSSAALGIPGTCYESATQGETTGTSSCLTWFVAATVGVESSTTPAQVDGSGWIPVNFTAISAGAPIGSLPVDPTSDRDHGYWYIASSSFQYELAANMESTKFANNGSQDVESDDGGNDPNTYETGSNVRL